jgi:hypothetical protein
MIFASPGRVRRLQARFHPRTRSGTEFVVVGHVVCDERGTRIEPASIPPTATKPFDSGRLHEKLQFLLLSVGSNPCRSLLTFRSGYWSFVELPEHGQRPKAV